MLSTKPVDSRFAINKSVIRMGHQRILSLINEVFFLVYYRWYLITFLKILKLKNAYTILKVSYYPSLFYLHSLFSSIPLLHLSKKLFSKNSSDDLKLHHYDEILHLPFFLPLIISDRKKNNLTLVFFIFYCEIILQ